MSKAPKTVYVCSNCGAQASKWQGQCSECKEWNTFSEQSATRGAATPAQAAQKRTGYAGAAGSSRARRLADVEAAAELSRIGTGLAEFDRVLGGGLVQGEVVLLGGDPGIGKSTILLQTLCALATSRGALYVSGEESDSQIKLRLTRLGLEPGELETLCEVELESILATLEASGPRVAVIDSIQTLYSSAFSSAPGTVTQVRECAAALARFAKTTGCIIILVGHVTKDGSLAGPRVLEHIVDAVLYFEGEPEGAHRIIRAFKNRFGAAQEVGIFKMEEKGLVEVPNPSALFIVQHKKPVAGACVCASSEGTRPLLVEIQALVSPSDAPNPKRVSVGWDSNRLSMVLAIIEKTCQIPFFDQAVYLNATGGARLLETGADLPAALSIISSIREKPLPDGLVAFGEIGLTGELRPISKSTERLREAAKMGFTRAILPAVSMPPKIPTGIDVQPADNIIDALRIVKAWEGQ